MCAADECDRCEPYLLYLLSTGGGERPSEFSEILRAGVLLLRGRLPLKISENACPQYFFLQNLISEHILSDICYPKAHSLQCESTYLPIFYVKGFRKLFMYSSCDHAKWCTQFVPEKARCGKKNIKKDALMVRDARPVDCAPFLRHHQPQ